LRTHRRVKLTIEIISSLEITNLEIQLNYIVTFSQLKHHSTTIQLPTWQTEADEDEVEVIVDAETFVDAAEAMAETSEGVEEEEGSMEVTVDAAAAAFVVIAVAATVVAFVATVAVVIVEVAFAVTGVEEASVVIAVEAFEVGVVALQKVLKCLGEY
jgi:hypothetical protein